MEVLHREAEELKRLLDGLGETIEGSVKGVTLSGDAQVDAGVEVVTSSGDASTEHPPTS